MVPSATVIVFFVNEMANSNFLLRFVDIRFRTSPVSSKQWDSCPCTLSRKTFKSFGSDALLLLQGLLYLKRCCFQTALVASFEPLWHLLGLCAWKRTPMQRWKVHSLHRLEPHFLWLIQFHLSFFPFLLFSPYFLLWSVSEVPGAVFRLKWESLLSFQDPWQRIKLVLKKVYRQNLLYVLQLLRMYFTWCTKLWFYCLFESLSLCGKVVLPKKLPQFGHDIYFLSTLRYIMRFQCNLQLHILNGNIWAIQDLRKLIF